MAYRRLRALLADVGYMRDLLNNGGILPDEDGRNHLIEKGWIDREASEQITETYHRLSAQDGTFLNTVIVVHDPQMDVTDMSVENSADRMRYILVTVIPDVPLAYQLNFPIIQTMGIMAFGSWEFARSATRACQAMAKVNIVEDLIPPILNNAYIEHVSIYVGKEEYQGGHNFVNSYENEKEDSMRFDLHLYEVRKMGNPLVVKLLEAYNADCADTETSVD